jgi:hypothetical protein
LRRRAAARTPPAAASLLALVRFLGFAAAVSPRAAAADEPAPARVELQLEAGGEIDSNVHRDPASQAPVTAPDARAAARLDLRLRPSPAATARLLATLAGKKFAGADAATEDVGVIALQALAQVAAGRLAPGIRASYLDAFQSGTETDTPGALDRAFRTGDAAATLTLVADGGHRLTASLGYRFFHDKPSPAFDFSGEQLGLAWTHTRTLGGDDDPTPPELSVGLAYHGSRRGYDTPALANACAPGAAIAPACLVSAVETRDDLFHEVTAEVTYASARIWSARYQLQIDDSNSFGQSLIRHRLELSLTSELTSELVLHARVVVVVEQFLDSLLLSGDLGTFATIDDDARNALILHATHDVSPTTTLEARWSLYTDAFAPDSLAYRRQTFYLGMIYRWAH